MTQYTKPELGQASLMMWHAGMGGGGPYVYCSCGKDHVSPVDDEGDSDPNEYFDYIEMDGQAFVHGCEGCAEKLAKYENFIWRNRDHIRRYLKIRIDQEKAWADQEDLLNKLAGI